MNFAVQMSCHYASNKLRNEIISCAEKSYKKLNLNDAKTMLFFEDQAEFQNFFHKVFKPRPIQFFYNIV